MNHDPSLSRPQSISKTALAEHLNVDVTSVGKIAAQIGLEPIAAKYPWRRIWRTVHNTEGAWLKNHHATLAACGSPILKDAKSLEEALKEPLLNFAQMAHLLGEKPDTLAKALREGRTELHFTQLDFGLRTRRYRRLEVLLWRDESIFLDLPECAQMTSGGTRFQAAENAVFLPDSHQNPQEKALFGGYASNKRPSPG